MGRALLEAGQHRPGPRQVGGLVVLAGRLEPALGVEQHAGGELHLAVEVTPQHVGAPEDARPHIERARALLETGNVEGSLAAARQAISADPQFAEARVAMARVLSKAGRLSDAAEELRRALQLDPLHADTHLEMGYCAAARGDLGEAMAAWGRYLRMLPNGHDAARVREALASAAALHGLLTGRAHG